jgi:hypothetical protein
MKKVITTLVTLALLISIAPVQAQNAPKKKKNQWYFSWGYNKEWYTRSTVRVKQDALDNDYQMVKVRAKDNPGWNEGLFSKALTIPQYNYRLGVFFNDRRDLGVEINFDHTKYIIRDGQMVHVKGKLSGRNVDTTVNFSKSNGYYYYLNNGANFLLFNIVKRWHFYDNKKQNIRMDFLGKAGIGPLVPHVENRLFGVANNPDFQLGGWNMGAEGALRSTFFKHVYLEFAGKLDYARYSHLHMAAGGSGRQAFGTAEFILSLGITM